MTTDGAPWNDDGRRPPEESAPQRPYWHFAEEFAWAWERAKLRQYLVIAAICVIGIFSKLLLARPTISFLAFVAIGLMWWFENLRGWSIVGRTSLAAFGYYLFQDVLSSSDILTGFEFVLGLIIGFLMMFVSALLPEPK